MIKVVSLKNERSPDKPDFFVYGVYELLLFDDFGSSAFVMANDIDTFGP